jgi:hypothetical protein
MQRLIFIASLSHSGSTLLDLILGGHPRFVGLGEVARVLETGPTGLEKTRQVLCSCGSKMDECIFWSKVAVALEANEHLSLGEKYQMVLDLFASVFGPDQVPVDSSKYIPPMQILHQNGGLDLQVLYLLKDVRAYVISQIDDAKREGFGRLKKIPAYQFRRWHQENRQIQSFLAERSIQHFQLGYEELCLHPDLMIQKICDFLGETPTPSMVALQDSGSHVIRGNRMRSQPEKRQRISYDHRWFQRPEWVLPAALLPNIMEYNAREVYSNGTMDVWRK